MRIATRLLCVLVGPVMAQAFVAVSMAQVSTPSQPPGLPGDGQLPAKPVVMKMEFIYVTDTVKTDNHLYQAKVFLESGGVVCATFGEDGKEYLERSQKKVATWERRRNKSAQEEWGKLREEKAKKLQTSGFGPGVTYDPRIKLRVGTDQARSTDLPPSFTVFCEKQADGCYKLVGNRETISAATRTYTW